MGTISIAATAAALNQHVVKFSKQISSKLRTGLELENELPMVKTDYAYTGQQVTIGELIQPYQHQFTPKGSETFSGVENILRPIKIDMLISADELEKFWSRVRPEFFTPNPKKQIDYFKLLLDGHIMPKVTEELNLLSWAGEYVAPAPGVAGPLLESVDGFRKSISDQVAAGTITPIATGAITGTVAEIRAMCEAIPEPYRRAKGTLLMNSTLAQAYADDYLTQFPHRQVNIDRHNQRYFLVDHYNKRIKPVTAMAGSNRVILLLDNRDSLIVGSRKGYPEYFKFRFEPEDRTLKIFSEIYRFYGFENPTEMFVNDQA